MYQRQKRMKYVSTLGKENVFLDLGVPGYDWKWNDKIRLKGEKHKFYVTQ